MVCFIIIAIGDVYGKYDVKFKKKFGQNFLKDINIVKKIVATGGITGKSLVIEVGPGGAIMTRELSSVADYVLAYEIDNDLSEELYKRLENCDNVDVLFQDFLQADLVNDVKNYDYDHLYFISNVPYYITTPIILKLIDSGLKFDKIVMMVQKEVGDRFSTVPGSREYGSITVLLNYFYKVKKECAPCVQGKFPAHGARFMLYLAQMPQAPLQSWQSSSSLPTMGSGSMPC